MMELPSDAPHPSAPRDQKSPRVVMVGAFPPPIHGMSAVNAAMRMALQNESVDPVTIDIAAGRLNRSLATRVRRLPKVLRGLLQLLAMRGLRGQALYMSVSGGLGQVYEFAFLFVARLRGMRAFLHHHSFAYLDTPSRLTRWLVKCGGANAVHIALSPGMAEALRATYGAGRIWPVSNAALFVPPGTSPAIRRRLNVLGFLANLSRMKGVFEFLDLCSAARSKGLQLEAVLAGPFEDLETERSVRERLATLTGVRYVGPKYGAAKTDFYLGIDALIFPTRYANEAEPVTLHEAMRCGVPVIAYGRGCIPEILGSDCGMVIQPEASFVSEALAQIERWVLDPTAFEAASRAAGSRFEANHAENSERWARLLIEVGGIQADARVVGMARKSIAGYESM